MEAKSAYFTLRINYEEDPFADISSVRKENQTIRAVPIEFTFNIFTGSLPKFIDINILRTKACQDHWGTVRVSQGPDCVRAGHHETILRLNVLLQTSMNMILPISELHLVLEIYQPPVIAQK